MRRVVNYAFGELKRFMGNRQELGKTAQPSVHGMQVANKWNNEFQILILPSNQEYYLSVVLLDLGMPSRRYPAFRDAALTRQGAPSIRFLLLTGSKGDRGGSASPRSSGHRLEGGVRLRAIWSSPQVRACQVPSRRAQGPCH